MPLPVPMPGFLIRAKTIPHLRLAQKYAVTIGGGHNQRLALYDGILIKENHITAAGGIRQVMQQAFALNTGKKHSDRSRESESAAAGIGCRCRQHPARQLQQ